MWNALKNVIFTALGWLRVELRLFSKADKKMFGKKL